VILGRIAGFFRSIYSKIFKINDTPQKIAIGFGVGVFLGVMPGVGPIAALFFSTLLRVNKASALLGSILTNTWLSIPVFFMAVSVGSLVAGIGYRDISGSWSVFLKDFSIAKLFQLSVYEMVFPVIIGYAVVALCIGVTAYLTTLVIVKFMRKGA
jgi:uncharacterized protein (DUF2062 family)